MWVEDSWSSMEMPAISSGDLWVRDDISDGLDVVSEGVSRGPVGYLDIVSGALFFTPGMWAILNRYLRVFSFHDYL